MRAEARFPVAATAAEIEAVVADLATWPRWLDVVSRAVPLGDGDVPAWRARLGLRLGPLDLGRDLRMVRVDAGLGRLRFVRDEGDGRPHSAVELDVRFEQADGPAATVVELSVALEKKVPLLDLQRELDRRGPRAVRSLEAIIAMAVED